MKTRATALSGFGAALLCVALVSCSPAEVDAPSSPAPEDEAPASPGLAAAERFLATWNSRDPEAWAGSLNYPHARPAAGRHDLWSSAEEYAAAVDYAPVIATGWDRTEFASLDVVHEGETKSHVAAHWVRRDAEGQAIRENLVAYIATEVDGTWGLQARFGVGSPLEGAAREEVAGAAVAKVEEYMETFNARDPAAWAATLNFPHLRIASGEVQVWETEEEYAAWMDFDAFADRFGWDHSAWQSIEAVQVAETAANVALTFSRYDADDRLLTTFETLYLVTFENGRWGVRARSSFAP